MSRRRRRFIAFAGFILASVTRLEEDGTIRLFEDGTVHVTEGT